MTTGYVRSTRSGWPLLIWTLSTALGLASVGYWSQTASAADWMGGGPEIGWIRSLLEAEDGTLYAGTWGGGIFRSDDGGRQWTEATSNARDALVVDLAEGDDPASTLYAASLDRSFLRREQGSDFWAELAGFPIGFSPSGNAIEMYPFRPTRLAFGTVQGVFVSPNQGATWPDTLTVAPGSDVADVALLPEIPNTVHALARSALIISSNFGSSQDVILADQAPVTFFNDIEPWSSGTDSMLVSDQLGPLWQLIERDRFESVGPTEAGSASNKYFSRVDPNDPDRILMGSSIGLWRSTDRLGSWELVDDQLPAFGAEIWAMESNHISASDSLVLGSFTMGVVRTGPGGDPPWTPSNAGLRAAWVRTTFPAGDAVLSATAHGRLYRSVDDGVIWEDVTGDLRTLQIAAIHDTGTAWVLSGFTGVMRSVDDGQTWQSVALPSGVVRLNHIIQSGSKLFAATNSGLACSEDDGQSFARAELGLPTNRVSFALEESADGHLAVGFNAGSITQPSAVYVGHPDSTFKQLAPPLGFRAGVRGISFQGDDLIVGADGFGGSHLFRVTGWRQPAEAEFEDLSFLVGDGLIGVRDVATRANVVLLGTNEQGVFLSEDGGESWREWNEGLPSRRIESVEFGAGREVWIGTLGRGAWMRELELGVPIAVSGLQVRPAGESQGVEVKVAVAHPTRLKVTRRSIALGDRELFLGDAQSDLRLFDRLGTRGQATDPISWVVEVESAGEWVEAMRVERQLSEVRMPRITRLLPAMPNPFNPRTTLRWEQTTSGRVRLDVFDARGQRVKRLVDRELAAGPHSQSFDGTDHNGAALASGVYYVLLEVDGMRSRARITLLR